MADNNFQILADDIYEILSYLKNIVKKEGNPPVDIDKPNFSTVGYPVLIGSRAAKWHVPSFREPNDWDLVATASQSILFIHSVITITYIHNIKLIHYPGVGLKIIGKCNDAINFEIELVSDKVYLKEIKPNKTKYENLIKDNAVIKEFKETEKQVAKYTIDSTEKNKFLDNVRNISCGLADYSFKIDSPNEFEFVKRDQRNHSKMSAQMILEYCHDVKDIKFISLLSFPCIVAPLKVLEVLKTSHIYWPANFHKNIADLHSLRIILGYSNVPITQPLCSPKRDEQIELILNTRIKETEILRGVPAAHINLNKTNQEFLDRDNDLFVQRYVPHDKLHEYVKYGDVPIHETLKEDKSKAWIKQSLFNQIDYQTQLNCVREEAMVIALERYLIPMSSKNQDTSYRSALVKICTSLTKGWFRQFAIDNYPRLSNLDKDLMLIAHNVINDHPLPQKKREEPSAFLCNWIPDLETLSIFEPIHLHTEIISSFDDINYKPGRNKDFIVNRSGIKITSPLNNNVSITAIITTMCLIDFEDCNPKANWSASVVICPSECLKNSSNENYEEGKYYDPLQIHTFKYGEEDENEIEFTSKHIFTLEIFAQSNGSWGVGNDVWIGQSPIVRAKSADHIASILGFPEFTGDLLFKHVLAYLQPVLQNNGSTPLKHSIDGLKANGIIPINPLQHLWYDAWNYTIKNRKGTWELNFHAI
ncbi:unnamed protein product [Rhizophagus irregularis]|uniref:Uncharacterized protein n=1 Tax=Rhizophagus irregularis TaxID=588596 RepID=A0A2N1NLT7_9GLOM|nr:hypothetical protein RhiirC2_737704 [Rhizophagus irregularis]CAB4387746.1 unnamed protein product [Rhizophagus irregularis]CAB5390411.1 unnamed protein product [Rhizophagus irregularis]